MSLTAASAVTWAAACDWPTEAAGAVVPDARGEVAAAAELEAGGEAEPVAEADPAAEVAVGAEPVTGSEAEPGVALALDAAVVGEVVLDGPQAARVMVSAAAAAASEGKNRITFGLPIIPWNMLRALTQART